MDYLLKILNKSYGQKQTKCVWIPAPHKGSTEAALKEVKEMSAESSCHMRMIQEKFKIQEKGNLYDYLEIRNH